jgi:hypothetical protein
MDFNDIKAILEQQGEAFEQFKRNESERITSMEAELNDLAKKAGRPVIGGSTGKPAPGQVWYDTKTKSPRARAAARRIAVGVGRQERHDPEPGPRAARSGDGWRG